MIRYYDVIHNNKKIISLHNYIFTLDGIYFLQAFQTILPIANDHIWQSISIRIDHGCQVEH